MSNYHAYYIFFKEGINTYSKGAGTRAGKGVWGPGKESPMVTQRAQRGRVPSYAIKYVQATTSCPFKKKCSVSSLTLITISSGVRDKAMARIMSSQMQKDLIALLCLMSIRDSDIKKHGSPTSIVFFVSFSLLLFSLLFFSVPAPISTLTSNCFPKSDARTLCPDKK